MSEPKKMIMKLDGKEWWREGVRFQCQGSGKCCTSHGEYGFVYMTPKDRRNMAKVLGLSTSEFTKKYCEKVDGVWRLKERPDNPDCLFLEGGNRCGVYEGRPMQCRTWPFWPEVLNPKAWAKDVVKFCPGVGKGRVWSGDEIEKLIREQVEWDQEIGK
ncbi:MAG TPA: YkgJ family cysteine cluster protein [Pseudobdellovibrionaceae bacterium]|nr:YkgJ family cysteine cluster protein [Pseudobdellovibrionaceae bacterium]